MLGLAIFVFVAVVVTIIGARAIKAMDTYVNDLYTEDDDQWPES
ncbi:membrane protein [Mycobacterium phage Chaser]|nr:membrane protein [Mycobacterium phage Chaser]